ncbi:unnamed protein product [Effrenium voratum]|nr:unnamed protein product [Effrenium voratum]|mmetsp:Transcript_31396/g.74896  ORF Transcript_31396/g.74896 Transcript_31396/m.74896 type:complete len:318 (-) Transcript_31396:84-1037(-)
MYRRGVLGDITNTFTGPGLVNRCPARRDTGRDAGRDAGRPGLTGSASAVRDARFREDILDEPMEDPQHVAEYVKDIYSHMQTVEPLFQPRPHYMTEQREINAKMRGILVDWLVEVARKHGLRAETLFMTVNLTDRYLSHRQVPRRKLQLCGVAAMFVAAKFEEIYPPEVKDFVYITDNAYSKEDILNMEVSMLRTLNFELCGPTVAHFLVRFKGLVPNEQAHLMQYLAELSMLEVPMLQYSSSQIAAAAAMLSNKLLRKPSTWPPQMAALSFRSEAEVRLCARELCGTLEAQERSPLQAIRKKFSQERFSRIARIAG